MTPARDKRHLLHPWWLPPERAPGTVWWVVLASLSLLLVSVVVAVVMKLLGY